MPLTDTLNIIAAMMEEKTGVITSSDSIEILNQKILQFILVHTEYKTQEEFAAHIGSHSFHDHKLQNDLVEHLLNHETTFYRDKNAFKTIQNFILPDLLKKRGGGQSIRIWSAACSNGQEPYSIALICDKEKQLINNQRIEIYGTDISEISLERAESAMYNKLEVQRGLPISDLIEYFEQVNLTTWQIKAHIRDKVKFFQHNLFNPMPDNINFQFDFILCRNVLIYFNADNRKKIIQKLAENLKPDGYLMLGSSESMFSNNELFQQHKGAQTEYAIYQKKGAQ